MSLMCMQLLVNATTNKKIHEVERKVRQPGIEPGSTAWKATMLTFTPPTLLGFSGDFNRPVANNSLNIDMLGSNLFHLTE